MFTVLDCDGNTRKVFAVKRNKKASTTFLLWYKDIGWVWDSASNYVPTSY